MRNVMAMGILLGALLLSGVTADATNWKVARSASEVCEVTEYVDMDSIQKENQKTKKAWVKLVRNSDTEVLLLSFTKDGKVKLLDYVEGGGFGISSVSEEWTNIQPDTFAESAYNLVWPVAERQDKKKRTPNRWERKGENTVDRAADRVINKMLRRIGW